MSPLATAMIGMEMARLGYKVIHIFFEDKKPLMWRKYYSRLTGKPISEIEGEDVEDLIRKNPDFNKIKENIVLVKWETGEKTVADIEQLSDRCISLLIIFNGLIHYRIAESFPASILK